MFVYISVLQQILYSMFCLVGSARTLFGAKPTEPYLGLSLLHPIWGYANCTLYGAMPTAPYLGLCQLHPI